MTPEPASKAGKAYEKGKQSAYAKGSIDDNPYILSSVVHLSNWWVKGFNEVKAQIGGLQS